MWCLSYQFYVTYSIVDVVVVVGFMSVYKAVAIFLYRTANNCELSQCTSLVGCRGGGGIPNVVTTFVDDTLVEESPVGGC